MLHEAMVTSEESVGVLLERLAARVAAEEEAAQAAAAEAQRAEAQRAEAELRAEEAARDDSPDSVEEMGQDSDGDWVGASSVEPSESETSDEPQSRLRGGRRGRGRAVENEGYSRRGGTRRSARLGRQVVDEETPRRSTRARRVSYAALEDEEEEWQAPQRSPPSHRVRLRVRHRH